MKLITWLKRIKSTNPCEQRKRTCSATIPGRQPSFPRQPPWIYFRPQLIENWWCDVENDTKLCEMSLKNINLILFTSAGWRRHRAKIPNKLYLCASCQDVETGRSTSCCHPCWSIFENKLKIWRPKRRVDVKIDAMRTKICTKNVAELES